MLIKILLVQTLTTYTSGDTRCSDINDAGEVVYSQPPRGIYSTVRGMVASNGIMPTISNNGEIVYYLNDSSGNYLISTTRGILASGGLGEVVYTVPDVNDLGEVVYEDNSVIVSTERGQIPIETDYGYWPSINNNGEIVYGGANILSPGINSKIQLFSTVHGQITDENTFPVTEEGYYYELSGMPDINDKGQIVFQAQFRDSSHWPYHRIYLATPIPFIEVDPRDHNFGDVEVGFSSTTIVSITNGGSHDLTLNDISLQDVSIGFSITSVLPTFPSTIAPSEGVNVEVTFSPSTTGPASTVLEIASDDPDEPLVEVTLTGTGVVISNDVRGCVSLDGNPISGRRVILKQPGEPNQRTKTQDNSCYQFPNVVSGEKFKVVIKGPPVTSGYTGGVRGGIHLKGNPVANRSVLLKQTGETTQRTKTDSDGRYQFDTVERDKTFKVIIKGPVVP